MNVFSESRGLSVICSFGKWGGFYVYRGFSTRICLGWMALTYIPTDIDLLFGDHSIDIIRPSEWDVDNTDAATNLRRKRADTNVKPAPPERRTVSQNDQ